MMSSEKEVDLFEAFRHTIRNLKCDEMTKEDRELLDRLKEGVTLLLERIGHLEAFVASGEKIPYAVVQNSSLLAAVLNRDIERLLMRHGKEHIP